tara:strand:+ start:428 stop:610 length:183 start_codon:yes stop_codon:yes gene_type:complete
MMATHDELIERVAESYDPDLIVEMLEITSEEILNAFEDKFTQKRYKFTEDDDEEEEEDGD